MTLHVPYFLSFLAKKNSLFWRELLVFCFFSIAAHLHQETPIFPKEGLNLVTDAHVAIHIDHHFHIRMCRCQLPKNRYNEKSETHCSERLDTTGAMLGRPEIAG